MKRAKFMSDMGSLIESYVLFYSFLGSFGEVFLGVWNGTDVAIKIFLEQYLTAENMEDFCNEISILRYVIVLLHRILLSTVFNFSSDLLLSFSFCFFLSSRLRHPNGTYLPNYMLLYVLIEDVLVQKFISYYDFNNEVLGFMSEMRLNFYFNHIPKGAISYSKKSKPFYLLLAVSYLSLRYFYVTNLFMLGYSS